jgi:hypothetical protein
VAVMFVGLNFSSKGPKDSHRVTHPDDQPEPAAHAGARALATLSITNWRAQRPSAGSRLLMCHSRRGRK